MPSNAISFARTTVAGARFNAENGMVTCMGTPLNTNSCLGTRFIILTIYSSMAVCINEPNKSEIFSSHCSYLIFR